MGDIPELVGLLRAAHSETVYSGATFSEGKVTKSLTDTIERNFYCCVVERDGKIIGSLIAHMMGDLFTDDLIATGLFFYVIPEYRGGKKAVYMLWNFIKWAKDNNARQIRAGISSGNLAAHRIFGRLGFETVGFQYLLGG